MMNSKTWMNKLKLDYLIAIFLIAFIIASIYPTLDEKSPTVKHGSKNEQSAVKNQDEHEDSSSRCDLFLGKWVFDEKSYPLYKESQCSFMQNTFACLDNGRKDFKYQSWKWQPHGCDLPRINGTALLERIRGKSLVFVGDSLNRNQWTSMLCLIEPFLSKSTAKIWTRKGNLFVFQAPEYNATIGFYWSPFLVESNADNPGYHQVKDRIIRIEDIEKHARHWTNSDFLVFDTFSWWHQRTMTLSWEPFGRSNTTYKRVGEKLRPYQMVIETWSDWLQLNVNRTKTKLFFMSQSPPHFHGESWDVELNCYNQTEPILKQDYLGVEINLWMMRMVNSTVKRLGKRGLKVEYLDITRLSNYRKDGHPSIYGRSVSKMSPEERANAQRHSDCIHWCLPGVPDFWNQILYAYIMKS